MKDNRVELFNLLVNEGVKNLKLITKPEDKVIAMAELAKAVALSSFFPNKDIELDKDSLNTSIKDSKETLVETLEEVAEDTKEDIKKETKEEIKPENKVEAKEEIKIKDEKTPVSPAQEEVIGWTEETVKSMAEEIKELKKSSVELGIETITQLVSDFSQGMLTGGLRDIGPTNIKAFLLYLEKIANNR